jgi:outer membrane protein assembly factor BamB
VSGDAIYVLDADEDTGERSLLCYNRPTGASRWAAPLHSKDLMPRHDKNSHASSTPACDGRRVYAALPHAGGLWVSAVGLEGRLAWQTRVGPFVTEWGYGSSVALYGSLVIVSGENKGSKLAHFAAASSYLAALNVDTGAVIWCVRRPRAASFGTPVVGQVAGRPQLLLAGSGRITSYDPATGRELWHCGWSAARTAGTVAFDEQRVYASAAFPRAEVVCVRGDGQGDVTNTHVVWRVSSNAPDVPSPLYHDGLLFLVTDGGTAACLDAATGRKLWQECFSATFSASPVLVDGTVYALSEGGATFVFKAARRYEPEAKNVLTGEFFASPSPTGGQIFLRSLHEVYCIGGPPVADANR